MAALDGLEQLVRNLNSISKTAVPRASVQAINRVASRAVSHSTRDVATKTRVPRKLVKQRAKLTRATLRKPVATIKVNRGNLPAIKLGAASVRLSRRINGRRNGSVLQIGRFKFPDAFIQQLSNGRWHVLKRSTKARYPIEVVSIPMATPLTTAFNEHSTLLTETDLPDELTAALRNQLRLILIR
ncbi:phage tail protein [Budviciaceae bacterium CWB-B4]|uniref:Phage tail protein n=1 Tax=Limnobaculum xujianqingii TaxID=2738837 RepID=A0A9D7AGD8_9GAMM|nr:phage tail protein [Limnobaculum xujianqingii]MBK5072229.1 phage tail protein [Limnobaculum xujianqingii]MBK5175538.1 phage tail protein [Limnobaculum xujianqingii]